MFDGADRNSLEHFTESDFTISIEYLKKVVRLPAELNANKSALKLISNNSSIS